MSTNMGNLEKLGILVIVILVVVVGVVAMTPKSTVDERLYPEQQVAEGAMPPEALESVPSDVKKDDVWPVAKDGVAPLPGGATASSDPKNPSAAETPKFRTVTVQAGDTLATIAKRELDNAARFQEIKDANPGLNPTQLKKGMEIKVPVSASTAKPTQASFGGTVAPAPSTAATSGRVYVVKSGDTLMSIAGREMGGSKRWPEIAKANEDLLHGSTALKVGMKLQIPGDAGSSTATASRDPAPSAGAATTGERDYVVKSGDTLWSIAKSEMGGESFLKELRAANQDVLRGSDSLKIGMKLKIPGKK